MADYRDAIPMLSNTSSQSTDEFVDVELQRFNIRSTTRIASMPISRNVSTYESENNFISHTGPFRDLKRAISGPLNINQTPESSFHPIHHILGTEVATDTIEELSSVNETCQDRAGDNYVTKNEHLMKSGSLGRCDDPYCTTCPMIYTQESKRKNSKASVVFKNKFHNARYWDAKGWVRRSFSSPLSWIPGVMNPHTKFVQRWNKFFVISCVVAIFMDPLYFFLVAVEKERKCLAFNWPVATGVSVMRSITDFFYFLHMLLQNRCVNMIAHLFHAPVGENETAIGVGTVGSSEAIMLAGLAFKRKWQSKRKAEGKPCDKPNIVTGANVQVCWEKFARYFEVELKEVKLREGYYVMDPVKAVEMVDENTICVAAILGSTLNGEFEDVKRLNELLTEKNKDTGWDTPIHVDAASGGFIAPFLYPDLEWDFRLPLVKSINVSGHKYGLVYAGIGWVVWRSEEDLPEELVFHINYLGADQPTFTLNFSKGSSQIIAQYYQFIRLGFEGYKDIMENCMNNAQALREGIEKTGQFNIISKEIGVPLVAFSLKDSSKYTVFDISECLRRFRWIVPAYTMAPDAQHIAVLRVVIREDFNRALAERLVTDIEKVLHELEPQPLVSTTSVVVTAKEKNVGEDGIVMNKSVRETQEEAATYWKKVVDRKKTGVC